MSDSRNTAQRFPADSPLNAFLARVHLYSRVISAIRLSGWGIVAAILAAVVAIFSDAAFAWPSGVRILIDLLAIAALGVALAAGLRWMFSRGGDRQRTALLVEQRTNRSDSLLRNALDFEHSEVGSPRLRERVIQMANDTIRSLGSADIVPSSAALRSCGAAAVAVVSFLIAAFVAPKLFGMVVPRFLDPRGDHPPYTLLDFDVSITPEPVYRGRPATITVDVHGPDRVEDASLIFIGDDGRGDLKNAISLFRSDEQRFVTTIARVEESRRFYISTPRGRSETHELSIVAVPFFESVQARIESPAYTGWQPQDQPLDQRGLRAIVGSTITITARGNMPLKSGTLKLTPAAMGQPGVKGEDAAEEAIIPLAPSTGDPAVVTGSFKMAFNGRFEILLTGSNGAESVEPRTGPLTAVPDHGPQVAIASPESDLIAVEGWRVPIVVEATDDVGVSKLQLFRTVNGWSPIPLELNSRKISSHSVRGVTEFDLGALGAKAGDVISYYASARDNRPEHPNLTDTKTYTLQVISEEEYKDFARQQYQMDELAQEFETFRKELDRLGQERQAALEKLDALEKQAEAGELTPEGQAKAKELQEQLEKFSKETGDLKKQLDERAEQLKLYEMEKEYTEQLRKLSEQLERQSKNASDLAEQAASLQSGSQLSQEQKESLKKTAEEFRKESQPFDQESLEEQAATAEDLELMKQADAMMAQTERLQAVMAQQRDLANRLAEMAGKEALTPDEQVRAGRFAKEQELLQQELKSVEEELRKLADESQEELPKMAESARQIADAIQENAIQEDQGAAAEKARDGNGNEAQRHSESAARKLEALQGMAGQCQQCQGLQQGLDGPLGLSKDRLGQMLQQLSQGRKVPGLGKRQGKPGQGGQSGTGQSQSASNSQGESEGGNGLWKPGQSFPGSQASTKVLGPKTQEAAESKPQSASMQSDGHGRFVGGDEPGDTADHESIDPVTRQNSGSSAGNLRGVPVGYRDAAEAYFRRLSEEAKPRK
jgi:hypothetical protein